ERLVQGVTGALDSAARRRPGEAVRIASDERDHLEPAGGLEAGHLDASAESRPDDRDAYLLHPTARLYPLAVCAANAPGIHAQAIAAGRDRTYYGPRVPLTGAIWVRRG